MTSLGVDSKRQTIARVIDHAREKLPSDRAEATERFLRRYYAAASGDDIAGVPVKTLYGAAVSHMNFARQRPPGQAKIRVYNPTLDEDGWQSRHTVVEIVNDDMPFLVDSVVAALNRLDLTIHSLIHPIIRVERDADGRCIGLPEDEGDGEVPAESYMLIEVSRQTSDESRGEIEAVLASVLDDVRRAVEDWRPILREVDAAIEELAKAPKAVVDQEDVEEAIEFLKWIRDDHFTFLGYQDCDFAPLDGGEDLRVITCSNLGVMTEGRDPDAPQGLASTPQPHLGALKRQSVVVITKSRHRATVHRPVHMDYIGVKKLDAEGRCVGERLFLGLFTSAAYHSSARSIPLLRRKVRNTLARSGFKPGGHDAKALLNVLETLPRDELFQIGEEELYDLSIGILQLQVRQRIRVFARRDTFDRFVTAMVFVPRERYQSDLRWRIQAVLEEEIGGRVTEFHTQITDSQLSDTELARLIFVVGAGPAGIPDLDVARLEKRVIAVSRSWADDLRRAMHDQFGDERGTRLWRAYGDTFPASYREWFEPENAVQDIEKLERVHDGDDIAMALYAPLEAAENEIRFKLFRAGEPIQLSDVLPMLENMGLKVADEHPYELAGRGDRTPRAHIHDFGLVDPTGAAIVINKVRADFEDVFNRVWHGEVENDRFNALVVRAGLNADEITLLRALFKYLRQTGMRFSRAYVERTLAGNPELTRVIVALFHARFDPDQASEGDAAKRVEALLEEFAKGIDAVANLDEDRILRRYVNLVQALTRTSYYQRGEDGGRKPYLALKFDPSRIEEMPAPVPFREIFVYSARTEGVHLRGGKVARGGLRWSERLEDFRTEILGLMKAQMVKNAVIVPMGAKGGFIVKKRPAEREALQREVVACYKTFIRGLLDITDNMVAGEVVPPQRVVRHDDDDPYLVVAADKGTATFSDIANEISKEYGFWLGDAFASGGSDGYDHKKMGITARGAWESVKRHFREMGRDVQSEDFTVIGIGDMGGDVFGNGMLRSRHTKLIGAFNHMHIFVDPDPDPEKSFAERERLFKLPRSTWADYDQALISKGGGVFERRAKSIPVSAEIKRLFGIDKDRVTPAELIRAMLTAEFDLLWFGGIGTFVKAQGETDLEVGDRANDAVRVNAAELRCKVIGEGANLGVTQLGRIEYALNRGRINTDAIDNSAGVDCSDHEVNIKILLDDVVKAGDMTAKQRNKLLADMTDEVAELVLRDNYLQTQAISLAEYRGVELLDPQIRLMRALERRGQLDRAIEALPNDDQLVERRAQGRGLTRPEISVLLAYAKLTLYATLIDTDVPEDPYLAEDLIRYFPQPLRKRFAKRIEQHPLRREIIATYVVNSMVNRVGATFVAELGEETGMEPDEIAQAYTIARQVFGVRDLWTGIEALDNQVSAEVQSAMFNDIARLVDHGTRWVLRNIARPLDIRSVVERYAGGVADLGDALRDCLTDHGCQTLSEGEARYVEKGVPPDLARQIAGLDLMAGAFDLVEVAHNLDLDVKAVARVHFRIDDFFRFEALRGAAQNVNVDSHWDRLAAGALIEDLFSFQRALTQRVFAADRGGDVEAWLSANERAVARATQVIDEVLGGASIDLAMLLVAARRLRALAPF